MISFLILLCYLVVVLVRESRKERRSKAHTVVVDLSKYQLSMGSGDICLRAEDYFDDWAQLEAFDDRTL